MQYTGAYQEAEHRLLFEGITKFNAELYDSKQLPHILRRMFKDALTGKPGPVHIDVENNAGVTIEAAEIDAQVVIDTDFTKYPPLRSAAEESKIKLAVDLIKKAKKPLLIVGRGAVVSGAHNELYAFAKKLDIPVVTSPDGKTIIDENDPLWAGIVGGYGMACANKIATLTDLAIFVGTQANDQTTNGWTNPPRQVKAIQIDLDPRELGMKYPDTIGLCGDVRTVLEQLNNILIEAKNADWRTEVAGIVQNTLKEYLGLQMAESDIITPQRLCKEVTDALPDNAVLFSDTGNSAIWSSIMIRMKSTQRYYRAAGSLGWSFPASLGGKCALPNNPVYCFCGDGAFYYHLTELETASRNGINTITIINNNNGFVQVRELLDVVYKGEPDKSKEECYRFNKLSLSNIAESFGCFGIQVTKAEDIIPAIRAAEKSGKPAIVEILTTDAYPPNPMLDGPRPLYGFADVGIK